MSGTNHRGIVIQPRDRRLLEELAIMRFIDREQAMMVAGYRSVTRVNARLLALYRAGALHRLFMGTVAGGRKAMYACSEAGARLVGARYQRFRFRNDELVVTNFFLMHLAWVNWLYCWAKYQLPQPVAASFVRWVNFSEPLSSSLTPDGYFEVSTPKGIVASFVEVDLGHEGPTVWRHKVQKYLQFAASDQFERQFHVSRFRVLIAANSDHRTQHIRRIVRSFTQKVFWFSTLETLQTTGFWSPVWQRPSGDELQGLV